MSDDSLVRVVEIFVVAVIVLSFLGLARYIPLVTNVFTSFLVDHIQGLVAGAVVGAFLGSIGAREAEVSIGGMTFTISFFSIAGVIVQYLLSP